MMKSICELYVICGMYVESCTILVVVNHLSRPIAVLDGLLGLYGFKYDSMTACGLPLYLYSYKLVGSASIIYKYHHKFVQLEHKHRIHQIHEVCGGIGQSKRHNKVLI